MGAFQAVASGLGQTGEEVGKGINDALTQALKVRAQQHLEDMDQAHLNLAQKSTAFQQAYMTNAQHQAATQFQQSHELAREQLIQAGWKDLGSQLGPDGKYYRQMYNDNSKQMTRIPLDGVPPDSPTGMLNFYKTIRGITDDNGKPMFDDMQAKQVAFKVPSLYREGPAGTLQSFIDQAKEMYGGGTKVASIPGIGKFDISTPSGQSAFGTAMLSTIHPGGLYRALNPNSATGKPLDQTGWTANEMREYNAEANKAKVTENALLRLAETQMTGILDPTGKQQQELTESVMNKIASAHASADQKAAEISARHSSNPNNVRGLMLIDGKWVEGTIPKANQSAAIASGKFKLLPPSGPADTGAAVGGQ